MSRQRQTRQTTPPRSQRSVEPSQMISSDMNTSQYYIPKAFDPNDYVVAGTTVKDIQYYKEMFDFLDNNKNGVLQPMDLRSFMLMGGYRPKKHQVYQVKLIIISDFDQDESGIIEFPEFIKIMTTKPCEQDTDEDIRKIFDFFDSDGKGYIDRDDLIAVIDEHHDDQGDHEDITEEMIDEMIKECDDKGDGTISWKAFLKFNKKMNY